MTLDEAVNEWSAKKRRMGCVSAAGWLCRRVKGFELERLTRYTAEGDIFQHVIATNGIIHVDLAPYADRPSSAVSSVQFEVSNYLETPGDVVAYLEEALADGDPELLKLAVQDVLESPVLANKESK